MPRVSLVRLGRYEMRNNIASLCFSLSFLFFLFFGSVFSHIFSGTSSGNQTHGEKAIIRRKNTKQGYRYCLPAS